MSDLAALLRDSAPNSVRSSLASLRDPISPMAVPTRDRVDTRGYYRSGKHDTTHHADSTPPQDSPMEVEGSVASTSCLLEEEEHEFSADIASAVQKRDPCIIKKPTEKRSSAVHRQQHEDSPSDNFALAFQKYEFSFQNKFESLLTETVANFKQQAVRDYGNAEKTLNQAFQTRFEREKLKFEAELAEKNMQIETLLASQSDLLRQNETASKRIKGLANLGYKRTQNVDRNSFLAKIFLRWRMFRRMNRDGKVKYTMARRFREKRLEVLAYRRWFMAATYIRLEREDAQKQAKNELERSQLVAEANLGKEKLMEENASLEDQLAVETAAKANLQANLKRVFMRGVCQLNFEAMNLLGGGAGGAVGGAPFDLDALLGQASAGDIAGAPLPGDVAESSGISPLLVGAGASSSSTMMAPGGQPSMDATSAFASPSAPSIAPGMGAGVGGVTALGASSTSSIPTSTSSTAAANMPMTRGTFNAPPRGSSVVATPDPSTTLSSVFNAGAPRGQRTMPNTTISASTSSSKMVGGVEQVAELHHLQSHASSATRVQTGAASRMKDHFEGLDESRTPPDPMPFASSSTLGGGQVANATAAAAGSKSRKWQQANHRV